MGQALLIERILGHVFPIGIAAHFAEVNEIVTNSLKEGKPANCIGRTYSFIYDLYWFSRILEYFDACYTTDSFWNSSVFGKKTLKRVVKTG